VRKLGPISCKEKKIKNRKLPLENLQQRFCLLIIGTGGKIVDKTDNKETGWE
jgi:hypothetical protein